MNSPVISDLHPIERITSDCLESTQPKTAEDACLHQSKVTVNLPSTWKAAARSETRFVNKTQINFTHMPARLIRLFGNLRTIQLITTCIYNVFMMGNFQSKLTFSSSGWNHRDTGEFFWALDKNQIYLNPNFKFQLIYDELRN